MKRLLYVMIILLLVSCVKETMKDSDVTLSEIRVPVTAEVVETKTVIDGFQISFSGSESMSLVCENTNATKITNKGLSHNVFSGEFTSIGKSETDARWYAVYPYVGVAIQGNKVCHLPSDQKAPFDGDANFMCSDIIKAKYDETDMPKLSLNMNQLLGIIKVSFSNSDKAYENELVQEVVLTSSTPLAGDFTVRFTSDGKPVPEFSGKSRRVLSSYSVPSALGLGKVHEVYISVNPAEIKDAEITIRTDRHVFTRKAKSSFTAVQGALTYMDPMDVATSFSIEESKVKTLVLWGDSYTNRGYEYTHVDKCNYAYHLQKMLGSGWKIYNGGCSGDVTNTIAARQGGIEMNIGSSDFTIPATTTPVTVGGVYSNRNYWFTEDNHTQIARYGLVNPCEIVVEDASGNEIARVEGTVTYGSDWVSNVQFTRTSPGEPVEVPAKSRLVTFAAKHLRRPDLTIIYMGQNGGFKDLDILYSQYRSMIEYAADGGPENYIVLGFHNHNTLAKWNADEAYWKFFDGPDGFGVNEAAGRPISRFVNLYKGLNGDDYKEMLFRSGAAASPSDVREEDIHYHSEGMIPYSYWYQPSQNDIHPSPYGAKAFALLIYDKMIELGYIR